ncbi:WhiB family transcriptional regulator [Thalassiella azotivora]
MPTVPPTRSARPCVAAAVGPATHEWMVDALCRQANPEAFYPEGPPLVRRVVAADAKAICAACPVRAECLDHALATGERWGIWGGLDEDERAALTRKYRIPPPAQIGQPS